MKPHRRIIPQSTAHTAVHSWGCPVFGLGQADRAVIPRCCTVIGFGRFVKPPRAFKVGRGGLCVSQTFPGWSPKENTANEGEERQPATWQPWWCADVSVSRVASFSTHYCGEGRLVRGTVGHQLSCSFEAFFLGKVTLLYNYFLSVCYLEMCH